MKTIILLRHAKSDRELSLPDMERPLAKRGLEDAPIMGRMLRKSECIPDVIISSPAKRAKETAELVAKACKSGHHVRYEQSFYGADPEDIVATLRSLDEKIGTAMVVGHNPNMENTVAYLLSHSPAALPFQIPTAGMLCLDAEADDWKSISKGSCTLRWFVIPKLVKTLL